MLYLLIYILIGCTSLTSVNKLSVAQLTARAARPQQLHATPYKPLDIKNIKQVVIWGHKLHSHTHSYVHWAFHNTFKHLGYTTYWFDNDDNVQHIDFANTLFITEGQVDQHIPLRYDCFYVLHYCNDQKYHALFDAGCAMRLEAYTDTRIQNRPHRIKIDECIYFDLTDFTLFIPWATDLLPHEIDAIKKNLPTQITQREKIVFWVGSIGAGVYGNVKEISPFKIACKKNGIQFKHRAGNISMELHRELIQKSCMAPAIVGTWQKEHGYVPCRAFKDISYGHMILTNSQRTYELFEKKIIYNPDTMQLFCDGQKRLSEVTPKEIIELMDLVRDKHTYINRIHTILEFIELIQLSHTNLKNLMCYK